MFATCFIEQLANVGEIFNVTALVRGQSNGMGIFLHRTINHSLCRLVMAQVNDFRARRLNQSAHDVYRRIMSVKQGGCGDHTNRSGRRFKHRVFIGHADATGRWFIKSAPRS